MGQFEYRWEWKPVVVDREKGGCHCGMYPLPIQMSANPPPPSPRLQVLSEQLGRELKSPLSNGRTAIWGIKARGPSDCYFFKVILSYVLLLLCYKILLLACFMCTLESHHLIYTGWPRKNGMAYFPQYVDAITGIIVWGNFSCAKYDLWPYKRRNTGGSITKNYNL